MVGKEIETKGMNKQLLKDICTKTGKFNIIIQESMNILKSFGIKIIKPIIKAIHEI